MKVLLKNLLKSFSGECDDLVFYFDQRTGRLLARRYVKPRISKSNKRFGKEARHLSELNPSPAYRDDLRIYIRTHNCTHKKNEAIYNNYYALYVTIMHAQAKALDLKVTELTRELIAQQNLPCNTVKDSVEAGFLGQVYGYERLNNPMVVPEGN